MYKWVISIFLILSICTGYAQADFYKWEDDDGNLHITDYPPPAKSAKKVKIHETDSNADMSLPPPARGTDLSPGVSGSAERQKPKAAHEVILYTTSWCPYCRKAKAFFDARGITYTEYDVEKDGEAARRKKELGSTGGVPFAIVNGERISGFSPSQYEAALKKNN